jgi:hypothetical protein
VCFNIEPWPVLVLIGYLSSFLSTFVVQFGTVLKYDSIHVYVSVRDFYDLYDSLTMVCCELKHVAVWYNIDH